jgi:hypothetical protein
MTIFDWALWAFLAGQTVVSGVLLVWLFKDQAISRADSPRATYRWRNEENNR